MTTEVLTDIPAVELLLLNAAAAAVALPSIWAIGQAEAIGEVFKHVIADHTPVGPDDPRYPDHLRDSGEARVIPAYPGGAVIEERQTKTVLMHDGSAYPLARLLTQGHEMPAVPILPVDKKALYWAGIQGGHPVGSSAGGKTEPIPYVAEAAAEFEPILLAWLKDSAHFSAMPIIQALGVP